MGVAVVVAALGASAAAQAQQAGAEATRAEQVRWWQYVVMFTAPIALELMEVTFDEGAEEPRWRGGILFDDSVRDVFVGRTRRVRFLADAVTDAAMITMWLTPTVLEGIITALIIEGKPDVAWQMIAINTQAYASSALVTLGLIRAVARERPMAQECATDPEYSELCESQHTRSFPSGHTASTFMGAGLICAHHLHLELWGSPADEIACGTGLVLATATGLVRLTADRHYVSDVVVGAGIGLTFGWLVPWLLHYSQPIEPGGGEADLAPFVTPLVAEDALGIQAGAAF